MRKMDITSEVKRGKALTITAITTLVAGAAGAVGYIIYKKKKNSDSEIEISEDDTSTEESKTTDENSFKPSSFVSIEQSKAYTELLKLFNGDDLKLCKYITSIYDTMSSADYIKALEAYKCIK